MNEYHEMIEVTSTHTSCCFSAVHGYGKKFIWLLFSSCLVIILVNNSVFAISNKTAPCFSMVSLHEDTVIRPNPGTVPSDTAREYILGPDENCGQKIRENLFVRAHVNKRAYYIGEAVVVTYKLYSRLIAKSRISKQPVFNGFSSYEMTDYSPGAEYTELIHNRPFKVHVLKKVRLIPLLSGTILLDPIEVDNTIHFVRSSSALASNGNRLQDLMDQLTAEESAPSANMAVKIKSSPLEILVKPFPEANRPVDFNGAVGHYTIKATLTAKNLATNDAGLLQVELKGSGNMALIDAPVVRWPAGIDTMDIRSREQINESAVSPSGTKTFEYSFMPLRAGKYHIPPISFSFFDPATNAYKTIQTPQNTFVVSLGNGSVASETKPVTGDSFTKVDHPGSAVPPFLKQQSGWMVVAILATLLIYWGWKNISGQAKKRRNVVPPLLQKKETVEDDIPATVNIDMLLKCRMLMENSDVKAFYGELNNVLWKVLTNKLNLPPSEQTKGNIFTRLEQYGWSEEMRDCLEAVLIKCERSVYLPDYHQDTEAVTVLETAQKIVIKLEKI